MQEQKKYAIPTLKFKLFQNFNILNMENDRYFIQKHALNNIMT